MTGGTYDILAEEGSTLNLQFEYQDENGSPVDISSSRYKIEFMAKKTSIKTDDFMFSIRSDNVETEGTFCFQIHMVHLVQLPKLEEQLVRFI